ncbi:MAG: inorganic diphosphatase [Anaerovoracaceae bacterium]
MNVWHDINPERIKPEDFSAVIEISMGDKNKYELDKETSLLIQLPPHIFKEIKHFYEVYKMLEEKSTSVDEVQGAIAAVRVIEKCIKQYNELFLTAK